MAQEPKTEKKRESFWESDTEEVDARLIELNNDPTVSNIVGPQMHFSALERVEIIYDQIVEEDG